VTVESGDVAALVAAIEPFDETERADQAGVLAWLASTSDVYRRVKPATPPRHLVSYALLTGPAGLECVLGGPPAGRAAAVRLAKIRLAQVRGQPRA
jgi:hypothetical protein